MSDETMTALERLALKSATAGESDFFWDDREFRREFPQLFELLSVRKSGEGAREPGSMKIFVDAGQLKCAIFLPSEGLMAFCALDRLSDLFQTLEDLIVADKLDWRQDKRNGRGSRGRV